MTNTSSRWSLSGRRALVTGATKGIGAASADELAALGAQVTLVARNADEVAARVQEMQTQGYTVFGVAADLSTSEGRQTALDFAVQNMSGIDILINNVGTNIRKGSLDYNPDEYEKVFATNLTSVWEMSRMAHPYLSEAVKHSNAASIVNIGSVSGDRSVGSGAPYAMTKAAIDSLTRYLAVEWAPHGIRVNAVSPWYTRTFLASPVLENPNFVERVLSFTPNRHLADPQDISGLVAFLCLPTARHITGQTIAVDGGYSARGFDWVGG